MKDLEENAHAPRDSWAHWLGQGETLLWHGRPVPGFRVRIAEIFNHWPLLTIGFIVTLIPAMQVAQFLPNPPQSFNAFLPFWFQFHILSFVTLQIGLAVWRNKRRASAQYSLTNQRAVIGYTWPFKSSREYRLPHLRMTQMQDQIHVSRFKPRSIYFRRFYSSPGVLRLSRYGGFDYLSDEDAKEVYTHLQRMHAPIHQRLV